MSREGRQAVLSVALQGPPVSGSNPNKAESDLAGFLFKHGWQS